MIFSKGFNIGVIVFIGLALMALACNTRSHGDTETHSDGFDVGREAKIVASTSKGMIVVRAGPAGVVDVRAITTWREDFEYQVTSENDTVRVTVKSDYHPTFPPIPGAELVITAPRDANIDLRTGKGRLEVEFMRGSGTLRTSNGKIELHNVRGEFDADTGNGAIVFFGELTPGGASRFTTSNGNVEVKIFGDPSVELKAFTSNGKIKIELPIVATETGDDYLVGKIGNGEAELFIRTSNGSITIR